MRLYIDSIGRDVDIDIEYKRTSRYLVRVTPDMNVRITCPLGAKTFEINRVLDNAKPWIAQRIKNLKNPLSSETSPCPPAVTYISLEIEKL